MSYYLFEDRSSRLQFYRSDGLSRKDGDLRHRSINTMVPLHRLPLSLTPPPTPQPQEPSPHRCHRLHLRGCGLEKRDCVHVWGAVHVVGQPCTSVCVHGVVYVCLHAPGKTSLLCVPEPCASQSMDGQARPLWAAYGAAERALPSRSWLPVPACPWLSPQPEQALCLLVPPPAGWSGCEGTVLLCAPGPTLEEGGSWVWSLCPCLDLEGVVAVLSFGAARGKLSLSPHLRSSRVWGYYQGWAPWVRAAASPDWSGEPELEVFTARLFLFLLPGRHFSGPAPDDRPDRST